MNTPVARYMIRSHRPLAWLAGYGLAGIGALVQGEGAGQREASAQQEGKRQWEGALRRLGGFVAAGLVPSRVRGSHWARLAVVLGLPAAALLASLTRKVSAAGRADAVATMSTATLDVVGGNKQMTGVASAVATAREIEEAKRAVGVQ